MKKKVRFWMYAAAGIVLAAVVTWACWPEYGKGYSEDQRRNWNEMITVQDEPLYWNFISSVAGALEHRRTQGDAPQWGIDFSKPAVELPLEGMTMPGLERLVDQGNGDACLELAFRAKSMALYFDIYPIEKNVRKAVKSGRTGAEYLLRLLEYRKRMGEGIQGSDVAGYADFVSLLGKGDFMLGKVYACLVQGDDYAVNRLAAALKERAGQGDVAALRNAGHLGILRNSVSMLPLMWGSHSLRSMVGEDLYYSVSGKISGIIEKSAEALPDSLRPRDEKIREIAEWLEEKIMSHYWGKIQGSVEPSFEMLVQAAEQGDLQAKFLWSH